MRYRGLGMVSANNSSRLLLDYKAEHPQAYWQILRLLFGEEGLRMCHLKVEMGSDINSSSGTEPSVKRTPDEKADATRGAAFQLAADAKAVNPELTLDMLWWSEPRWVSDAADVYAARYQWYKETLTAAYKTYGLVFDYVSAVQNERAIDGEWIKYLSSRLKSERDCPYDFASIQIVAGDEVCTWETAEIMLRDETLLHAVDVIGSHYTSWSTENAQKLAYEHGKELWFSEACPAMSYAPGVCRFDGKHSGLTDIGGALDVANRVMTMYSGGRMTLCEIQPAVAAYYDGVTYCSKQLILANQPWSGHFELDSSFYAMLHFSRFIQRGWAFIDGACHGDGKPGGDGHAIVDALYSYMTAADPASGDYSLLITNTTDREIRYSIEVTNLPKASAPLTVWETRGPDSGAFDENYFRKIAVLNPETQENVSTFTLAVKPYSMITASTIQAAGAPRVADNDQPLPLPYRDDYRYHGYPDHYLAQRGGAPRYTTDQGGAFEVCRLDGKPVLMQMITPEMKAHEWGATPAPVTCFGDDRWFNYSVSVDVLLDARDAEAYVGVGLRYVMGGCGESGYWARLDACGRLMLMQNAKTLLETAWEGFDATQWHRIRITAVEKSVSIAVDGQHRLQYCCDKDALSGAGRAALYSSYHRNCFANFAAEREQEPAMVRRYDDMDGLITYTGHWDFTTTGGWKYLRRTCSVGMKDACASFTMEGSAFLILGENEQRCQLQVTVDGVQSEYETAAAGPREVALSLFGLPSGRHWVQIKVLSGAFCIDGLEVLA